MKLKKVKTLFMITAVACVCGVTGVYANENKIWNVGIMETEVSQLQEIETEENESASAENEGIQMARNVTGDISELTEQYSVSQLILPRSQSSEMEQEEEPALIIANVNNYVNIRSLPGEEGEILGKLYDDSIGTMQGEENGWYYITSGSVTGYVKAEYVLTGEAAVEKANEVGTRLAKVTTTTLKVRESATTEAIVLGLVPEGDILSVLEETEGWVKVSIEEGEGFISTDYANVYTENVEAESIEEEQERLRKEEEARRIAEEAARKAVEAARRAEEAKKPANNTGSSNTTSSATSKNPSSNNSSSSGSGTTTQKPATNKALGEEIANYALQFVGNPYVYGGTSLTNGADCSGFVMSVYAKFGISLPRTSGEQGKSGSSVNGIENAVVGDLVWYSGHIGIYIGNGQIVHASNARDGIKISQAGYRTILGVRRIV